MVLLETPEGTVLVSGDVSRMRQHTVNPAHFPRKRVVDVFVLESTFGGRGYRPREVEVARIVGQVRSALDRGGHVLIASSALGIAQEILLVLAAARARKEIWAKVWVDGVIPAANAVYAKYAAQESVALARFMHEHGDPFVPEAGVVRVVSNQAERETLLTGPPAVLVSSSANLQTGPSAFYANQLAGEEEHLLLLPVQELREGVLKKLKSRSAVEGYSLSTHATQNELATLARQVNARHTILVHGGRESRHALAANLATHGLVCIVPSEGETITVDTAE
jgi:Cft2 family RNA processing exonuclease